ncbi:MAG: hypothetical protein Q7W54_09850 [Bacteroidota bacterium]|nr:hypothetical protein [Bacteroidota bacterium]
MLDIKKTYVTDSRKRPIAVQIDIQTFEKMEQLLEDYALAQYINENNPEDTLSVADAKAFYTSPITFTSRSNSTPNFS